MKDFGLWNLSKYIDDIKTGTGGKDTKSLILDTSIFDRRLPAFCTYSGQVEKNMSNIEHVILYKGSLIDCFD